MSIKLTIEASLGPGAAAVTGFDADEANDVGFDGVVVAGLASGLASGFLDLRNHDGRCILA